MTDLILSEAEGVAVEVANGAAVALGSGALVDTAAAEAGIVSVTGITVAGASGVGGWIRDRGVAVLIVAFCLDTQLAARPAPAVSRYFKKARRESPLRRWDRLMSH